MFNLGPATLQRIVDFDPFALPLGFILPGANIEELRPYEAILAPHHVDFATGKILLAMHSLLLRTPSLTILIDTCVGEHKHRPRRQEWHARAGTGYIERLAQAGVAPDEIDVVLCTHLHADHVGWNTRLENGRWAPTFPKARYLIGGKELDHWQAEEAAEPGKHNHGAYTDSVLPVIEAGLTERVEDGFALGPGLDLIALPGHSPGQPGLCLDCGAQGQALFCADAIHSPVQVYRPKWASAFCTDREQTVRTRLDLFERSAGDNALLIPAHLRHAHAMRVQRHGGGYRPVML